MKLIVGLAYVYILKNFSQYISLGYASTKTYYIIWKLFLLFLY